MGEKEDAKTRRPAMLPTFSVYHPNSKGNGSAVAIRISPATIKAAGYVQVEVARQQTVGDLERRVYPTFNWKERIITRLTPVEAGEVVMCLRGMTESVRGGSGFQHRTDGGASKTTLVHVVQPRPCHQLKVEHETIAGTDREASSTQ